MSFQALLAPLLTPMLLATAVDERSIGPQSPSKMSPTRTPAMTMDLMSRETHRQYGRVPLALNGRSIKEDQCIFADGKFVLRTDSGYSFLYVPGEGVLVDRSDDVDASEEELWLNGSVYAAVACLNGLYPIHASAVAADGRVHAFTGASGAGKSTLVAGLGQRGLPLFCDDTMLLDLSNPDEIIVLPEHKRLKLTDHALMLTQADAQDAVGADTGKSYALPPGGTVQEPLPLARLIFLEAADRVQWKPLVGAERFARLADDHYTQRFYWEAQQPLPATLFALRARLAQQVVMARLLRPWDADEFSASVDLAEAEIRNFGKDKL